MVVNRNSQSALGLCLPDNVLVQNLADFQWRGQSVTNFLVGFLADIFANDVQTEINAFIADENAWTSDEFAYFMLTFTAEGAIQQFFVA